MLAEYYVDLHDTTNMALFVEVIKREVPDRAWWGLLRKMELFMLEAQTNEVVDCAKQNLSFVCETETSCRVLGKLLKNIPTNETEQILKKLAERKQ